MKISKKNLVESKKLTESEDEEIAAIAADGNVAETALDIEKGVEAASGGELTVEPVEAAKAAIEIQRAADDIDAKAVTMLPGKKKTEKNIVIDSELTRVLDLCLNTSKKYRRRGQAIGANLLVSGLPGSGKTAGVSAWARERGVYLMYLDAKDPNLETILNGFPVRDMENGVKNSVTRAYSDALRPLDEHENCVLFLDEYNRAKAHIRASLLTLINEKQTSGNGEGGKHTFNNLLFSVACINPSCSQDKGADRLNDAEKSRFLYNLTGYDSDKKTTRTFLTNRIKENIDDLDKDDKNYKDDFEEYARILDLATFLMDASDEDWHYDTEDQLQDLYNEQAKMCNQRSLVEGLFACGGDVRALMAWIERGSGFLEQTKQDLLDTLKGYTVPTIEELCDEYDLDKPATGEAEKKAGEDDEDAEAPAMTTGAIEDDDEEGFWTTPSTGSGASGRAKVKSEDDVVSTVLGMNWSK